MNEIHLVLKDELDGTLTIRFETQKGMNVNILPDSKAKRLCKFIVGVLDNIPKRVMQDMLEGAQVHLEANFLVKPRGGIKH